MNRIKYVFVACLLSFYATTAFAIDPIPEESGFSGFVLLGAGVAQVKSNMVSGLWRFDIFDDTINSVHGSPDSETEVLPSFNFELRYTFAETGTQLFAGNSLEDLLRWDVATEVGVRQDLQDLGIVAGSFVFNSIATEVWKDPYDTTRKRDETDRTSNGFRLTWDKILSTNLQVECTVRNVDVDKERSGTSPNLAWLTPSQIKSLSREGDMLKMEVLYRLRLTDNHRLIPAFIYLNKDLDGDAMSADVFDFQLTYRYSEDRLNLIVNALFGRADYDKRNPIYGKTREDDRYGASVSAFYALPDYKPLGCNGFSIFGSVAYHTSDPNISFYETEVLSVGAGVMLRY
jgi:hypothetical protein